MPDLYREYGRFRYSNGFNIAGLIRGSSRAGSRRGGRNTPFVIGFPLGLVLYLALMKALVCCLETRRPRSTRAIPTTIWRLPVGRSWAYLGMGRFARPTEAEGGAVMREDL